MAVKADKSITIKSTGAVPTDLSYTEPITRTDDNSSTGAVPLEPGAHVVVDYYDNPVEVRYPVDSGPVVMTTSWLPDTTDETTDEAAPAAVETKVIAAPEPTPIAPETTAEVK